MSDDISAHGVKKFDGNNFQAWKFQLTTLFFAHGIQDVVNGTRERPVSRGSVEEETWMRENAKVMFLMSSSMDPRKLELLLVCVTAREMWTKLSLLHEQRSEANKMVLLQKFYEYRMSPADSMEQHIATVENMAATLIDVGEPVSDNAIAAKLVGSLTSKYAKLRTAWDSVDPARQTLENLASRLIGEEMRLNSESEVGATALAVSKVNQSKKVGDKKFGEKKQKTNKNMTCFNCHEKGHFARECDKKREKSESDVSDMYDCAFIGERNGSVRSTATGKCSTEWCGSIKQIMSSDTKEIWLTDSGDIGTYDFP